MTTTNSSIKGDKAPDFYLPEASEKMVALSEEVKRGTVVLLFYPTDFGITCTMEFKRFQAMLGDFSKAGGSLYGVSVSSTRSHRAWKESVGIDFPLLSDFDAKVTMMYDVMMAEDSLLNGHSNRAIFVIDKNQVIRFRWVPADHHAQPDYDLILRKVQEVASADR